MGLTSSAAGSGSCQEQGYQQDGDGEENNPLVHFVFLRFYSCIWFCSYDISQYIHLTCGNR